MEAYKSTIPTLPHQPHLVQTIFSHPASGEPSLLFARSLCPGRFSYIGHPLLICTTSPVRIKQSPLSPPTSRRSPQPATILLSGPIVAVWASVCYRMGFARSIQRRRRKEEEVAGGGLDNITWALLAPALSCTIVSLLFPPPHNHYRASYSTSTPPPRLIREYACKSIAGGFAVIIFGFAIRYRWHDAPSPSRLLGRSAGGFLAEIVSEMLWKVGKRLRQ